MNRTLETAPWPDFAGNPIREGDTIRHPYGGEEGVVFVLADETDPNERWRVLYGERGDGWPSTRMSRLCLQVGDKGRAVVVRGVPDQFAEGAEVSPATQLRLARAYRDLLNHAHDEWRARAQRVYCDLRDAIAGLTGAEPQLVQETFEELALRQRFTALPSVSAEQLMRAVDMLRGTAKAGEVQCFTTAATMPINPADCSIGEGSGSACLDPVDLAKHRDDLRRYGTGVMKVGPGGVEHVPASEVFYDQKWIDGDLARDAADAFGYMAQAYAPRPLDEIPPLFERYDYYRRSHLDEMMAAPARMLRMQPREIGLSALSKHFDREVTRPLLQKVFDTLPHPESAIGYQRLTQLAQVHRSRCDQAFARVAMYGHAPVPFNPETWTGNWKTCPGLAGNRVP